MAIVLGSNRYGKAESRVVRIYRDTPRHGIRDLNVSTALRGDFARAHTDGDQADVLPTDTQKNTAFAYAKEVGVSSPEEYAVALATHFLDASPKATGAQVRVEEYAWDRIPLGGDGPDDGHDHSFVRRGTETRTCVVTVDGRGDAQRVWVVSGLEDLVVLKSTGSEFRGFLKDAYTTLEARYATVRQTLLSTFATTYSRALQETLYAMGKAVLETQPRVAEIRFSAPNKHHFLYDLDRFGLKNDGEVFVAADRPYGLIEASVVRDDATDPGEAWTDIRAFL